MIALAMLLSLTSPSFAGDSEPPRPVRSVPFVNECAEAVAVTAGEALSALDTDGLATCSGLLVPTSEVLYLKEIENWAGVLYAWQDLERARAALAVAQADARAARARRAVWIVSGAAVIAIGTGAGALYVAADL